MLAFGHCNHLSVLMLRRLRYLAPCLLALACVAANASPVRAQEPVRAAQAKNPAKNLAGNAAKDAAKSSTRKKTAPKAGARISYPPMIFFVARGAADECGPGCDTWIAAFGEIDSGAASRFERFLKRLGKHDMPIFIQSPGGLTLRATVMGELLRKRKLKIAVGRTVPVACGDAPYSAECNKIRQSGPRVASSLKTNAACASACVYMLLGGATREVAWDAALGVHSSKVVLSRKGRQVRHVPKALIRDAQRREAAMIDSYVRKMGIAPELMTVTRSVPFESIRRLTREEIARFGIDRRDFGDSGWSVQMVHDRPAATVVMFRKGWGEADRYALIRLALSCLPDGAVELGYLTHGAEGSNWPPGHMVVRFGEERVPLLRRGTRTTGATDRAVGMLSREAVERLEQADSIALLHESGSGEVMQHTPISKAGFAATIRKVTQCARPGDAAKEEIAL